MVQHMVYTCNNNDLLHTKKQINDQMNGKKVKFQLTLFDHLSILCLIFPIWSWRGWLHILLLTGCHRQCRVILLQSFNLL